MDAIALARKSLLVLCLPAVTSIALAKGEGKSPAGSVDWHETFDHGPGLFTEVWGEGVDFSVPGQVTLRQTADDRDSGMMVRPTGQGGCWGYGVYTFTLAMAEGTAPGPFAVLWPSTDHAPGPEIDVVQRLPGGDAYAAVHWRHDDDDAALSPILRGLDVTKVHTYAIRWEAHELTGYVDGHEAWSTREHVPADYDHGGENECPGIGMQTGWSEWSRPGRDWITIYDASYRRL
jgi:beta-glucanase (GH16 family)